MKRLFIAAVVMTLTACGGLLTKDEQADEFRNASPSRQGVEIKMPAKQALESGDLAQGQQRLLGEVADWYKVTRAFTLVANGATAWVLELCENIVSYPPTTIDEQHAVWGPWTESLSPNTWRFTVTKAATGYDYVLEAKGKSQDDGSYRKLITGHHEPGAAEKQGQGTFTLDWNACQQLPMETCKEVGQADFTYSRNAHLDVSVGIHFEDIKDDQGRIVDADYAYSKVEGGEGAFDFRTANTEGRFTVKSRWLDSGAGRSDVKVVTPSNVTGTVTECWDTGFLSTYYTENVASWQGKTWGQASSCAFTDAVYSTL